VNTMEVTETTMREFFTDIVNKFTGLDEAARRVDNLTQQVEQLTQRVSELEMHNSNLRTQLDEAWGYARKVEQESKAFELELQNSREHTRALSETIVSRDGRVTELETRLSEATSTYNNTVADLQSQRNRNADLDILLADLRTQLEEVTKEKEGWKADCQTANNKVAELTTQLDKLRNILNPQAWTPSFVETA